MVRRRNQNAFSQVELMVASAIMAFVIAFAGFAAHKQLQKQRDLVFEMGQFQSANDLGQELRKFLSSAAFIWVEGETNQARYGIERWPFRQPVAGEPDGLLLYTYRQDDKLKPIPVKQIFCENEDCLKLEVPSDDLTRVAVGDLVYVSDTANSQVRRVVEIEPSTHLIVLDESVHPLITAASDAQGRAQVLMMRITPVLLFPEMMSDGTFDIRTSNMDPKTLNGTPGENQATIRAASSLVLSHVTQLNISYSIEDKVRQGMTDPCNPPASEVRFIDNETADHCTFNNIRKVRFEIGFQVSHESSEPRTKTVAFEINPIAYEVKSLGEFLELSKGGKVCDERIESQRCLADCKDTYRNPDYKPGSDYCKCKGTDNFSQGMIDANTNRWNACCRYRNAKLVDNGNNNCWFAACSSAFRSDNPDLPFCEKNYCSRANALATCLYTKAVGLEDFCNPAGGGIYSSLSSPSPTGYPGYPGRAGAAYLDPLTMSPPRTTTSGNFPTGHPDEGKQFDWRGNNPNQQNRSCNCIYELYGDPANPDPNAFYSFNPSLDPRMIALFPGMGQQYNYSENTWGPWGGNRYRPTVDPQTKAILGAGYHGSRVPANMGYHYEHCFNPKIDNPASACYFQGDANGNITSAAWDLPNFPGDRDDPGMAIQCACYRAGLPHDPAAVLDFNGFNPKGANAIARFNALSNNTGRCSCLWTDWASKSTVNVWTGANQAARKTQIDLDCFGPPGPGGPPPPTPPIEEGQGL